MSEAHNLLNGVQYDHRIGEFANIMLEDDGEVVLYDVFTGEPYDHFESMEAFEGEAEDFDKVSEDAVNDPVRVIELALDAAADGRLAEYDGFNLRYARWAVSINENSRPELKD